MVFAFKGETVSFPFSRPAPFRSLMTRPGRTQLEGRAVNAKEYPLRLNNDGWEKDTDARRWRWYKESGRTIIVIPSFSVPTSVIPTPVAIIPSVLIADLVVPTSSVLITAMISPVIMIFAEGGCHIYTAYHQS
jgi:hypothetical protein